MVQKKHITLYIVLLMISKYNMQYTIIIIKGEFLEQLFDYTIKLSAAMIDRQIDRQIDVDQDKKNICLNKHLKCSYFGGNKHLLYEMKYKQ